MTVPRNEALTVTELRSALEVLTPAAQIRLRNKAIFLAQGTGMEAEDLLQETVVRSLEEHGGRKCPRSVRPEIFLGNVMRSLASHAREKWVRESPIFVSKDDQDDFMVNTPDPSPGTEQIVIGRVDSDRELDRIVRMFDNDSQAQAIVIGIMEDWSPHEIRDMEAMSEKEYNAARKRVRRTLLREASKGRTYEREAK